MKNRDWGRTMKALVLAALMVSVLCVNAFAASAQKNLNSNLTYFTIETGSGWQYWLGWKKTTVTITNTGNKDIYVSKNLGGFGYDIGRTLSPGRSFTYTASGSGKRYSLQVQRSSQWGRNSAKVTTSAGSVW